MTGFAAPHGSVRTLHDCWESMARRHANAPCLGTRDVDAKTGTPGKYTFRTVSYTHLTLPTNREV